MITISQASYYRELDILRRLIAQGRDLNEQDAKGHGPLHWAVIGDYPEVLKILIESGSNINLQNNNGQTPLHVACFFGKFTIAKELILAGADLSIKDVKGKTPMDIASRWRHEDIVQFILSRTPNKTPENQDSLKEGIRRSSFPRM